MAAITSAPFAAGFLKPGPSQRPPTAPARQIVRANAPRQKRLQREAEAGDAESEAAGASAGPGGEDAELAAHVQTISSPSNPFVKHLVKLRQSSSYRHEHRKLLLVGATPLRELSLSLPPTELLLLLLLQNSSPPPAMARRTVTVSPAVMRKLAGVDSTDAVSAAGLLSLPPSFLGPGCSTAQLRSWACLPSPPRRVLALDGVQDPGNLGSLLRSAAAFAWDAVLLLPGCCDPFNPKAVRASRGACLRVPMASLGGWSPLLALAEEHQLALLAADAAPDGLSPQAVLHRPGICLVLGSEGQGLSQEARQACSRICIPMPGQFESLNVAVAGGILMLLLHSPLLTATATSDPPDTSSSSEQANNPALSAEREKCVH